MVRDSCMQTVRKENFNSLRGNFGLMENLLYIRMLNQQHQPTLLKIFILWKMHKPSVGLREHFFLFIIIIVVSW